MTFSRLNDFSKVKLGHWPTPLVELQRLGSKLGVQLSIKRDDLTGLALGGNKTRKLEYILGDAVAQGCDTIITAGAAQSNHCRQTAAAAAMLGMKCHLMLGGVAPQCAQGNLLLDELLGAQIHWMGEQRKGEELDRLYRELNLSGSNPYIVPYGGSNELGAMGYVSAVQELALQQAGRAKFDCVIFASSSGGTHAGLTLGNALSNQWGSLVGINIDKLEAGGNLAKYIADLTSSSAIAMGLNQRFSADDIRLNSDYLGDGYGILSHADKEAIAMLANQEGILLDPVYSGRAFAGLIGMIRSGQISRGSRVLFWHTGGAPALFAYAASLSER